MYKVDFPPRGGIESSCWGRKSSGEEGKGKEGRPKLKGKKIKWGRREWGRELKTKEKERGG